LIIEQSKTENYASHFGLALVGLFEIIVGSFLFMLITHIYL